MTTRCMQLRSGTCAKGSFFRLPSELRQHILYYAGTSETVMGDVMSPRTRLGRIICLSSSVAEDMVKVVPRLTEQLSRKVYDVESHEKLLRDAAKNGCCNSCEESLQFDLEICNITRDQLMDAVNFLVGLETTLKKMAEVSRPVPVDPKLPTRDQAREVRIPSRKRKRMSCP